MDTLSDFINQTYLQTDIVFSGEFYGTRHFRGSGYIHVVKSGFVKVSSDGNEDVYIDKPSVIFFPSDISHCLTCQNGGCAEVVMAAVNFHSFSSSLKRVLPSLIYFELRLNSMVSNSIQWLFQELLENDFGRQTMIEKLSGIFVLQVLREASKNGDIQQGVLSAVIHPQLSKVIKEIHGHPSKNWTVDSLANVAAMSRSKFASNFRHTIGQTPNDYITDLRLGLAQKLLRKNKPIGFVASEVGYEHGSALARIFKKKVGMSPRAWLQSVR